MYRKKHGAVGGPCEVPHVRGTSVEEGLTRDVVRAQMPLIWRLQ